MHFVLSKPIEKYNGSIGDALRHYFFMLTEARKERSVNETDEKSRWSQSHGLVLQNRFLEKHKDDIEFIPQFELGKYLKQLEKLIITQTT